MWNINRARVETALTGKIVPAEGIFIRWKNDLIEKIKRDSKNPKKRETWTKIKTLWFSIDPGGKVILNNS
ncbi:hypothetical protein AYI70_g4156 [Smittium culicis]|uniref:Uncharacterized protein n=1 Tax=Smittium culicis TaxID=133412 RepID=A0A1R1Y0Y3_9FUNG|nr:hypothetical protein AYI70_g4156 [Smittium culicis]